MAPLLGLTATSTEPKAGGALGWSDDDVDDDYDEYDDDDYLSLIHISEPTRPY